MAEQLEYENEKRYKEAETKFYETGDLKYLWEVKDDIEHAIRSAMRLLIQQRTGSPDTYQEHFYELAEEGFLYFLERCKRGYARKQANSESKLGGPIKGKLITYCYWIARYLLSSKFEEYYNQQGFEDTAISYDDLENI